MLLLVLYPIRVSPPSIQCLYTVYGDKHFFDHYKLLNDDYILLTAAINYFRRLYITYGGHILLLTAIYYFRRLYITFDGYILLLDLPDSDFERIQDFLAISCIYGLKARLEFNINL